MGKGIGKKIIPQDALKHFRELGNSDLQQKKKKKKKGGCGGRRGGGKLILKTSCEFPSGLAAFD